MMHRDTMLKFGRVFDLAKYSEHTKKFQHTGYCRGLVAPTLNFGTPCFISETNRARKLKFGVLVDIYEH